MSLARRSVTATGWQLTANGITVVVMFVRSVLLARWLPVEVFGVYGLASAVVSLSAIVVEFGMGGAFLHRAPETADEEQAAAVHFTLNGLFTLAWALALWLGAWVWAEGEIRVALLVLVAATVGSRLTLTSRLILHRRVVHRRLALYQVLSTLLGTLAALGLAALGATLWALLITDLATLVVALALLVGWRPVWVPRLAWSPSIVRYYLHFGSRNVMANALAVALDRVDDLWTGLVLGETQLGLYSRAYRFATYPRSLVAVPVGAVIGGTYAELKGDRRGLSRTFVRANALLVRSGFFLAGLFVLVAPEFIRLVLDARWLPMLDTFRLMLIFTMLDPIKTTVGNLFVAVGQPQQLVQARLVQLAVLAAGLWLLGPCWGIAGVAVAVDAMLVAGMGLLLWQARTYVDFSLRRVFAVPVLALGAALGLARAALALPGVLGSDWRTGGVKLVVFAAVYGGVLLALEYRDLRELLGWLRQSLPASRTLSRTPSSGNH